VIASARPEVTLAGAPPTPLVTGLNNPAGVAVDSGGNLYIQTLRLPIAKASNEKEPRTKAAAIWRTCRSIILAGSAAVGCDVWVTGDGKSVGARGEMILWGSPPGHGAR
jgi:hypothetical protein